MPFLRSQLRLCYIIDATVINDCNIVDHCRSLLDAGLTTLLFRIESESLKTAVLSELHKVTQMCLDAGRYVFSIDDMVLASQLACSGVFFSEMPNTRTLHRARELLGGNKFIGVTVNNHSAAQEAEHSHNAPHIDFIGVGPVLQYGEKETQALGIESAQSITALLRPKPLFWLGGIQNETLDNFTNSFADGVGVVRTLTKSNPAPEARKLHITLARKLGPSVWSVGHAPADVSFRFNNLSTECLKSTEIPSSTAKI